MPTGKFKNEQDPSLHPGALHWPGTVDGFPALGPVSALSLQQYPHIQLVIEFRCDDFRMWEPEDRARYVQVKDHIANGYFLLRKEKETWDDEHKAWRFWLEWEQVYGDPSVRSAGHSYPAGPQGLPRPVEYDLLGTNYGL
jgi:hypothetical protein